MSRNTIRISRKMNELDEEIDQIHNDLAHLMEEWETQSEL